MACRHPGCDTGPSLHEGRYILAAGALLALGLAASLLATRVRLPSLVLFLAVGMLVGSDGLGLIAFDDYELARLVGIVALALILFDGGLAAGWSEVRPVLVPALSLATVGTVVTALVTGLVAMVVLDASLLQGLLLGGILSSTDGAAIFALLRGSTLRRRLARTLEGESGFNDPVAVLLVLGFIAWIQEPGYGILDMLWDLIVELGIGAAVGLAVGELAVRAFRLARLSTGGLYPVMSLAVVAVGYGAADVLHGSGFMAVYLAGLALGSAQGVPARQTIQVFHEGMGWVAQLSLFVVLGLLIFPSGLVDVAVQGTLIAVALVFVARPVAGFVATIGMGFTPAERLVLGWAGLRGAVPVVLATFPVIAGIDRAVEEFEVVFFAVLLSTVVQGTTVEPLAKRLGLTTNEPALPRPLTEAGTIRRLGAEVLEFPVGPEDAAVGTRVRDLELPREAVVNVIVRGQDAIPPRGSMRVRSGDVLHVLLRMSVAAEVRDLAERWRRGPLGPGERPPRPALTHAPVLSSWTWDAERDGDPGRPELVRGHAVVERLRVRRDAAAGLFLLADGRYAVTGSVSAVGGRTGLAGWASRRIRTAGDPDERAWLQTVVGALASELR